MTTTETLKTFGLPLGALTLGASTYLLFALVAGDPYPQNERKLLVCNERFSDVTRAELLAGGATLRPAQRYGHVARVMACASPDAGTCGSETNALAFLHGATERVVVGDGRCELKACDSRCETPERITLETPPCVTPACWDEHGAFDSTRVADCKRRVSQPGLDDSVWQGCATMPREEAVGTECVPTSCEVFGGDGAWAL